MGVLDIVLRILNNAPLVTKGAQLTSAEIDTGFIGIFNDVNAINNPINVEAYDNGRTYVGGVQTLVSFDSALWRFISLDDKTGISPGSDETVWNKESINRLAHEDNNIAEITRADLIALQAAETVKPGRIYNITDRDIFVFGLTTKLIALEGVLLARNADYQNVGGNVLGVWTPAIDAGSPGLQANDIAIFDGLHFKSLTGSTSAVLSPPNDPANWLPLDTTDSSYINELDEIHYDITNDVIIHRADKRGNIVHTQSIFINSASPPLNPIDVFQWGNDSVLDNFVGQNSILSCINNLKQIKCNRIENADVTANMQTNNLLRSMINIGVIDVSGIDNDIEDDGKIFMTSLIIESADVLTLNGQLQIVAAPGADKKVEGLSMITSLGFNSSPYTTNTDLQLITDTATKPQMVDSKILLSTASRTTKGLHVDVGDGSADTQLISDKALMVKVNAGNPAAGDSLIKVIITYRIVNQ